MLYMMLGISRAVCVSFGEGSDEVVCGRGGGNRKFGLLEVKRCFFFGGPLDVNFGFARAIHGQVCVCVMQGCRLSSSIFMQF
jgi:hypothetical protein